MSFKTVQDYLDDPQTTTAERLLIEHVKSGTPCILPVGTTETDGTLPLEGVPKDNLNIRAPLLRLLIMGGTENCGLHPSGVWLEGAHVTEVLDLRFTKARGQCALDACRFDKTPRLQQAECAQLSFERSHLPGLSAHGIKIEGSLFLRNLTTTGMIDVNAAKIGGQLDCSGAAFTNPTGKALNAQGVEVGADLFLSYLTATGTVYVGGAKIGGQLSCDGATFTNPKGCALNAQGVEVGADLFLINLTATGIVEVNGAKIGGQLSCDGATFTNPTGKALNAQDVEVGAGLFLNNLTATGAVDVAGAKIGGQLACEGATFTNPTGKALNAQGVETGADIFLSHLTATGMVAVTGAKIGGQLNCIGASFTNPDGGALSAQRLYAAQGFLFRKLKSVQGQINLDAAHVSDLVDDATSWPTDPNQLYLNGFTYDRIGDGQLTFDARKDWLANGSRILDTFSPQPYTQFAKVLREMGHASEARKVIMERERILFDEAWKTDHKLFTAAITTPADKGDSGQIWLRMWCRRLWAGLASRTVGYGHAPERALFWSLGLILFGTVLYFIAYRCGLMVPNSDVIMVSWEWQLAVKGNPIAPTFDWLDTAKSATHYETFFAALYATDVFLPLVDFGQESTWAATTTVSPWGHLLRFFTFAYQIAGWVITALGIAAITGFVQKGTPD